MTTDTLFLKCWVCKETKFANDFWKDKTKKSGYQSACKFCQKEQAKRFKLSNPEYFIIKGREKYAAIEDKEAYNKKRYSDKKEEYLARRFAYWKSIRGRFKELLCSAKGRANNKNIEFNLTYEWILDLYDKQGCVCSLTGIAFDFDNKPKVKRSYNPYSPSLDRIDTSKGYTQDNVRLVLTAINIALNDFGEETYRIIADSYLNFNCTKKTSEDYQI